MKKTFTQNEFYNHGGCWRKERNKDLRKLIIELSDSNGNISFESLLLSSLPSLQDKVWWIMNSLNLSLIENRYLALESAKSVANIYNKKYPNDKRISLCINMTARYLKGLVSLDILIKYKKDANTAALILLLLMLLMLLILLLLLMLLSAASASASACCFCCYTAAYAAILLLMLMLLLLLSCSMLF